MNKELSFYDLKTKKKFTTDKYKVISKNNRKWAVAKSQSGTDCWRAMPKSC